MTCPTEEQPQRQAENGKCAPQARWRAGFETRPFLPYRTVPALSIGLRVLRAGLLKEPKSGRMFGDSALREKNNFIRETAGLTNIVGHQYNLRPPRMRSEQQFFNGEN